MPCPQVPIPQHNQQIPSGKVGCLLRAAPSHIQTTCDLQPGRKETANLACQLGGLWNVRVGHQGGYWSELA